MLFGSYQLSIGWELLNYIGNQNPVCICMSRHTSIPSSPVLIFYLNFERVATLVPRAIILCIWLYWKLSYESRSYWILSQYVSDQEHVWLLYQKLKVNLLKCLWPLFCIGWFPVRGFRYMKIICWDSFDQGLTTWHTSSVRQDELWWCIVTKRCSKLYLVSLSGLHQLSNDSPWDSPRK